MTGGPLYVDPASYDPTTGQFRCVQDGHAFGYDLDRIRAAIARGEDVREQGNTVGSSR